MAEIFNFPHEEARDLAVWRRAYYLTARDLGFGEEVAEHAIDRVREHWEIVFAPIDLALDPKPVPGKLSREQAVAIQEIIDAASLIVVERLKNEREVSFQRLMTVELERARLALDQNL